MLAYMSDLDARYGLAVLLNRMENLDPRLNAEAHKRRDYSLPPLLLARAPTGIGCREPGLGEAFVLALRASILHVRALRLPMAISTHEPVGACGRTLRNSFRVSESAIKPQLSTRD